MPPIAPHHEPLIIDNSQSFLMRIALLADIHGNLGALEAVLADLQREPVDQLVCLGDVAIFGPQPRQTLARVRALGCPVVMGNTDAWALDPHPHPVRNDETPKINAVELWTAAQLRDEDRAFIRTFAPTVEISLGQAQRLLCYHGSPRSFHHAIVATTPEDQLGEWFAGHDALILAGGHTHAQFLRRWQDRMLLNPGSVGLPYERLADGRTRNPPWAEYAVLTWADGRLGIDLRRTPVDLTALQQAVRQTDMPFADWWLAAWQP
jgi:putative phosphoesterase